MIVAPAGVEIECFRGLVAERLGLHFEDGKLDFLADVLRQRMEDTGCHLFSEYRKRMSPFAADRGEVCALAGLLTVGETYFFRYTDHFRAFSEVVLPSRIRARGGDRQLRILSAGCASGEEPYSIAILMRERFPELASWNLEILGFDVNPSMVGKAKQARYSPWSLRETPDELQSKYFRGRGRDFQLDEAVRSAVGFEERNLVENDPLFWRRDRFDAIFCRNVTMYLTMDAARFVVARFAQSLAPGGFLFFGHAETLRSVSHEFHLRHTHETFYYQRREARETECATTLPDRPGRSLFRRLWHAEGGHSDRRCGSCSCTGSNSADVGRCRARGGTVEKRLNPRILIVDDSLTVRMDLGEAFEQAGFEHTICSTLSEARQAISKSHFGLIVLDVLLPDGDGIEFLQEIRTSPSTAATPVMLLSSEAEVRDRVRGLNTGADDYVGKPYDRSYVVARARELLRKSEPPNESARSKTVLVIDDSPTFREELKSVFESSGYSVITAGTGEDGLRAAVDVRPAVILVDGVLPGIDGSTVIRRIRADAVLRSTPCILLTASEERTGELRAFEAGADAYVRKEVDPQIILARVTAVLRSSGTPSTFVSTSSLLGPKRILTVDDSLTYLLEVAAQLREEGYDVVPARSGEEALELLAVQTVDCILLDLVMPGFSGQETCRHIKGSAAWRDIPLIMHTALEEQDAMIKGINAGADDYIAKSSDLEVLRARVRAQLRRKQFEDENRSIREQLLQKELEVVAANSTRELAETRAVFVEELERKNSELESFSYSVSHDLRAPLRSIDRFSQLLLEDYGDKLDSKGEDYLHRVSESAQRMGELIDDLLLLSRVGRAEMKHDSSDLSSIARAVFEELKRKDPDRQLDLRVAEELVVEADSGLMRVALDNLLGNAWKFTAKVREARIEIGTEQKQGSTVFFVRDNGAGFDMSYAENLFRPFQRLHTESDFPGTGIGLATVHRIIDRHGGRIWAEGAVNQGATFYFTIPPAKLGGRP